MLILQMPARVESLHELLTFIRAEAKKRGFSENAMNRIDLVAEEALVNVFDLVAEEALVNVFVHGYAENHKQGQVEVRCPVSDDPSLTIEIRDTGVAFDPLSLAEPDVESDLTKRKIGGMGVFFMRKMTDKVAYRREGDSNVLTMTFSNR